jgi:hypothetical protein
VRSKVLRVSLFTLFLLPYFLGIFGTGLHFVPNPSLRWIAASAAVLYCLLLSVSLVKTAPPRAPGTSKTPLTFIRYSLGFPVIAYFVYVCFYMSLPAAYTEAFGSLSQKQYQIERVKTGGAKAVLCEYRLQLRDVVTVLDDSFCVSEEFASRHSPGQSIVLTGKRSTAGFRFHNAS